MSEAGKHLYLHELSLAPKERLRRTKKLPSPEPYLVGERLMLEHSVSAIWSPDDTIVCLKYSIKNRGDPRGDETGRFQVPVKNMLKCEQATDSMGLMHQTPSYIAELHSSASNVRVEALADPRLMCCCSMQALYLMDVAAQTLAYLSDTSGTSEMARVYNICFTPDSSMVLLAFHTNGGALLEVHSRNAQILHRIQPEGATCSMAMACLSGHRVAVTSDYNGFTVWDLLTGQQAGSVQLHEDGGRYSDDEELDMAFHSFPSLISTDSFGKRLAYVESDSVIVHLYDAVTLQPSGVFGPPAAILSSTPAICGLSLGIYSCLLTPYQGHYGTGVVRLCSLESCSSLLQSLHTDLTQAPVTSADAAFLACICKDKAAIVIKVYDARSGAMVLAHESGLQGAEVELTAVTWTSSGLLVTAHVRQAGSCRTTDHITMLQF